MKKKVLIIGGTSGLGEALAVQALEFGAQVAVVARSAKGLSKLRERVLPGSQTSLHTIEADVSKKEDIYRIAHQTIAQLGGLDVIIHSASSLGPTPLRPLIDGECEDFEQVIQTNLLGPYRLTKALLGPMLLQQSGTVVFVSSDAAVNAYPGWGFYGASKAAADHLSRVWGEELKEYGVRVITLDPGDMDTPLHAAALPDADRSLLKPPALAAQEFWKVIL